MSTAKSEKELEQDKVRAWARKAKGHPMRWRILRDGVAVLSLGWMSTSEFQTAMRRLWALKNKTSRDLLEELEEEGSVIQEREERTKEYKWGATRSGVAFWVGKPINIPASVAQVALTIVNAAVFEE